MKLVVVNTSVPKFSFFWLKSQILSWTTNTVGCFPRNDRLTLFTFEKMSAKHPNRITTVVSHFTFHVKTTTSSVCDSNNCTGAFPGDSCGTRVGSGSALCGLSILSHRKF